MRDRRLFPDDSPFAVRARRILFRAGAFGLLLLCAVAFLPGWQEGKPLGAEQQNIVELPPAAHRAGQTAGYFVDPVTGHRVYRLSDPSLCPGGGRHFYSYTNQFSAAGNIVFTCLTRSGVTHPVYGPDFRLVTEDAARAAGYAGGELGEVQWSQSREVLFARAGNSIVELDPFHRKKRVVVDFIRQISQVRLWNGSEIPVRHITALSVGPGDRLLVHLQCRRGDPGCPGDWSVIGVATFDPATGKHASMAVPHASGAGYFDEAQWTQNPEGRVLLTYANRPAWIATADLSSFTQVEDNHGHPGYVAGSDGHSYRVSVKNDTVRNPDGTFRVGQVGCKDESGRLMNPWRPEYALYDDVTGRRALIFGCELGRDPDLHPEHFARSIGTRDVFASSGKAIVRFTLQRSGGAARVSSELIAYTRTDSQRCGYWAQSRAAMDHTGTRFLFDSSMNHPRWPARESDGSLKSDCRTDVYVVVANSPPTARP